MSEIIKENGVTSFIIKEDIVADKVAILRKEILDVIAEEKSDVIIDLSNVEMIDSSGIGVIISTQNSLKKDGKSLKVIGVSANITKMFKIMRLDSHFEIVQK